MAKLGGQNLSPEFLLKRAQWFFKHGQNAKAQVLLQRLVGQGCVSAEVFHMLASISCARGHFSKGIRLFEKALHLDPSFTDASIGLSIVLNDLGKYEQARRVFEKAQKSLGAQGGQKGDSYVQGKMAHKHFELAELYWQYGWKDQAKQEWERALVLRPKVAVFVALARAHMEGGDFLKAQKLLKKCLEHWPKNVEARSFLGLCYYRQNLVPEAISHWEKVLHFDPTHSMAKQYLQKAQSAKCVRV